jgi:hypothetical protein
MTNILKNAIDKYINLFTVLVAAAIVIYIRQPLFFYAPRIWAEEGSVYLFNALVDDPISSFLTPHYGYYSLFNKIAIHVASQLFPLRYAAFITTSFSVALQLCTCLVIYASPGRLGRSKLHRYVLSMIPLFVAYPETWLNTINGHFWLATGTYFILNSARINLAQTAYLLVAFMTGAASLFFLPYFVLRAVKEQEFQLWLIVILGVAAAHVQFFSLLSFIELGVNARFTMEHLASLPNNILSTAILPLQQKGAGVFFVILMTFAIYKYAKILIALKDGFGLVYSLVSLCTYTLMAVVGSLYMVGGSRYGVPVHCAMLAIAFCGISLEKMKPSEIVYFMSLAVLIILILESFFSMDWVYSKDWPNWQKQIESRLCDQATEVLIFPQWEGAKWKMTLPKGSGLECKFMSSL